MSVQTPRIDVQQIKRTFDLFTLAAGDTTLRKSGSVWVGPCPFCGAGRDRFTLRQTATGWRWSLRQCEHGQGGASWWGAIKYVQIREGLGFLEAVRRMTGDTLPLRAERPIPQPVTPQPARQPEAWRKNAREFLKRAQARIKHREHGAAARAYLWQRGIIPEFAIEGGGVGCASVHDPTRGEKRDVLVFGHYDVAGALVAVNYRYLPGAGLRYRLRKGSLRAGLYLCERATYGAHTLIVLEGELNALAIWQAGVIGGWSVDACSVGAQDVTQAQIDALKRLAVEYRRVIVWADEPDKAKRLVTVHPRVLPLKSPVIQGQKIDAAALLNPPEGLPDLQELIAVICAKTGTPRPGEPEKERKP